MAGSAHVDPTHHPRASPTCLDMSFNRAVRFVSPVAPVGRDNPGGSSVHRAGLHCRNGRCRGKARVPRRSSRVRLCGWRSPSRDPDDNACAARPAGSPARHRRDFPPSWAAWSTEAASHHEAAIRATSNGSRRGRIRLASLFGPRLARLRARRWREQSRPEGARIRLALGRAIPFPRPDTHLHDGPLHWP